MAGCEVQLIYVAGDEVQLIYVAGCEVQLIYVAGLLARKTVSNHIIIVIPHTNTISHTFPLFNHTKCIIP